ncbi:uncharacterized protein LACBIDRAFT_332015 [Laccaria bicolor S238N-H82]|uniref:Predicted protein n=1 Tax=Laccaria bicolor (strain S238N-H82 / ATCC MYA-4686) TaxID=486041 RepID=B0DRA3_LACBS|nr:uncharacterized protein LACBIDRAFT_332015 [Laccaria bicolor S238N-H82]EDR02750.1 predicted protein [Laccaria bicolor S238N-H82]|eukprot:XP_001886460.1 predicted protein [Laccaria bicolor S238N-H82]
MSTKISIYFRDDEHDRSTDILNRVIIRQLTRPILDSASFANKVPHANQAGTAQRQYKGHYRDLQTDVQDSIPRYLGDFDLCHGECRKWLGGNHHLPLSSIPEFLWNHIFLSQLLITISPLNILVLGIVFNRSHDATGSAPLSSMDPEAEAALEEFVVYLRHQRQFADVYDYLLNLSREIALIWYSPWKYTKFMYLIVRYVPFAVVAFLLHLQLVPGMTKATCHWIFPAATFVLMIRTWAIWRRDKRVGCVFVALSCLYIGLATAGNVTFVRSLVLADPPYPGFRGCFVLAAANSLTNDYGTLVAMESRMFQVCTCSCSAASHSLIVRKKKVASVANVIFFTAPSVPLDLHVSFVPLCSAFYAGLTSRVVLNIREVALGDYNKTAVETQLHDYKDDENPIVPLSFRLRSQG